MMYEWKPIAGQKHPRRSTSGKETAKTADGHLNQHKSIYVQDAIGLIDNDKSKANIDQIDNQTTQSYIPNQKTLYNTIEE